MANYCTACGRPVTPGDDLCGKCGEPLDNLPASAFNSGTPASAEPGRSGDSPASRPKIKHPFRWGWALRSGGLTFFFIIILASFFEAVSTLIFREPETMESAMTAGYSAVAALSYFLGSGLASYLSPGRTIYEPAVGVALAVVVIHLISVDFEVIILGWVIPFGLGILGAKAGDHLQEKTLRAAKKADTAE